MKKKNIIFIHQPWFSLTHDEGNEWEFSFLWRKRLLNLKTQIMLTSNK